MRRQSETTLQLCVHFVAASVVLLQRRALELGLQPLVTPPRPSGRLSVTWLSFLFVQACSATSSKKKETDFHVSVKELKDEER
jgi:hypothetical protein